MGPVQDVAVGPVQTIVPTALLAREWGGQPTPQTVTQLERYTYLASVTLGARTTKPFLVRGLPAAELHAEHRHPERVAELEQAITETADRRPVAETLKTLDGHDERIREHLERQPNTRETGEPGEAPPSGEDRDSSSAGLQPPASPRVARRRRDVR